ncbi:uncharacterized protein LY89DRAFT_742281 [Mollisia scopiformis]|uniref:RNA polymerase II degradation factor 1 n=1 Tax=Mollisia scopiformis TaxID=149040 RepID=A0A132B6F8_MOLSC|nr:uncharacterized protein LY89DRAFT_742281 [Mollisia scopiformis]KUJ07985.1 hypothetical protein LY89DRAFT_742281 [Mollisia scopiformis]
MSEVQSRPAAPRGRGSARGGGRGGFSSRGGRGGRGHATNGDKSDTALTSSIEDDSEVGQLKKKYGTKVSTIKEMFPDWTDEDVVFALQETDGDLETTVDRITDGTISQWGEVSKTKKDRSRSKVKDATVSTFGDITNQNRPSRGGRAGFDGGRGGRGRGADRGRAGRGRGTSTAHVNGSRNKENVDVSTPTADSTAYEQTNAGDANAWETKAAESSEWDNSTAKPADTWDSSKPAQETWGSTGTGAATAAATSAANATSSIIPDGVKKSWASMFAKPAPAPAPKKAPEPVIEKSVTASNPSGPPTNTIPRPAEPVKTEEIVEPVLKEEPEALAREPEPIETVETPPVEPTPIEEPELTITPSKDELTENNVEQLPDTSNPAPTATAASTAASSWDPRSAAATPYSASQAQAVRPPTSGFQASALKATGTSGRTSSYNRRILDQEEAVRMPGNREVDRAAVQFGAFNLNGTGEDDVDGEREEAETRAQPPQHSPVAPRASLPPAPQQPVAAPEAFPTPKQTAGLPAATHPTAAPGLPSPAPLTSAQSSAQSSAQQAAPGNSQMSQYGRYGPSGVQDSALPPKPYDAFSQQAPSTQSPFEGYQSQQSQSQPQQSQAGAFSSAPDQFSSYYTADPQQRNAYNNYYNQYGMQQGAQSQEGPASQQRSFSGYNGPQSENSSQFPQSAAQQTQSRYATAGEGQNSGHTTPNPVAQSQQPGATQSAQPQPGHQQQPQYPYGHPYYSSPYYAAYMNQYQQYGGNYPGGPYGAKGGLHQPYQGYGMSPAAPYDHAASPAAGGFGASSLHGRDSALGGLSDYGRAGSAQSSQTPGTLGGSGAFGGAHDAFGRGSSYQGQAQQHYNTQQGSQPSAGDDLKPFGDSKTANGPSPSLSQAGRPGSATNTAPGSVLPLPQSQQGGYGGYPAHLQQGHGLHGSQAGSQYGGLGGAGGHQAAGQGHQNSQYGGYQGFGGGNYYGNNQQRGGWGGNYGH